MATGTTDGREGAPRSAEADHAEALAYLSARLVELVRIKDAVEARLGVNNAEVDEATATGAKLRLRAAWDEYDWVYDIMGRLRDAETLLRGDMATVEHGGDPGLAEVYAGVAVRLRADEAASPQPPEA